MILSVVYCFFLGIPLFSTARRLVREPRRRSVMGRPEARTLRPQPPRESGVPGLLGARVAAADDQVPSREQQVPQDAGIPLHGSCRDAPIWH